MQRRKLLSSLIALGGVALAGCSGNEGNGSGDEPDSSAESGSCPSLPLSYTTEEIDGETGLTFEIPEGAEFEVIGDEGEGLERSLIVAISFSQVNGDEPWDVELGITQADQAITEVNAEEKTGIVDVTGEYSLAVEDAKVHKPKRGGYQMYLPITDGIMIVSISRDKPSEVTCSDAALAVLDRLIETLQPVE